MKVKVISLPYIFQVLYVLCFTGERLQDHWSSGFSTLIVSVFIPTFFLFKGRNQATHNIRNQDFSLQLPVLQKTKQTIILTTNHVSKKSLNADCRIALMIALIMPPTLKKLMGHIAFGACVGACVRGWVTLFVPTVTFKPLKLES